MCNGNQLADAVHGRFGVTRGSFLRAAELAAVAGGVGMVVAAAPASPRPRRPWRSLRGRNTEPGWLCWARPEAQSSSIILGRVSPRP